MPLRPLVGRIAGLDGLRAVAVLLVLNGHIHGTLGDTGWGEWVYLPIPSGDFGVQVFFVISGFLITTLLLRERSRFGSVSFAAFFRRRCLRILPAAYTFLAVMVVVGAVAGWWRVAARDAVVSALFVVNYSPTSGTWQIGHLWSLAIEEQFYLVWPLVLAVFGRRVAFRVAVVGVVAVPLLRVALWFGLPDNPLTDIHRTHARGDALVVGALLAMLWASDHQFRIAAGRVIRGRLVPLVAVLWVPFSATMAHALGGGWRMCGAYTADALAVAVLIVWLVEHPEGRVSAVMNSGLLVHVGVLSYSLYLWQQPFTSPDIGWDPALRVVGAFVAAELSLRLVERPFLRIKDGGERSGVRVMGTTKGPVASTPS